MSVSGIFTATIADTYVFSTHARASTTQAGVFHMKKNDDVICDMWVVKDDSRDIPSCSKVKVTGSDTDPAGITSNTNGFSGILIYAD